MSPFVARRTRPTKRRRGQAMVEFALVIPIFLLIFVALFDLGRAVFAYNTLTNAAREGVRLAIVNQDKPSIIARAKNQTDHRVERSQRGHRLLSGQRRRHAREQPLTGRGR